MADDNYDDNDNNNDDDNDVDDDIVKDGNGHLMAEVVGSKISCPPLPTCFSCKDDNEEDGNDQDDDYGHDSVDRHGCDDDNEIMRRRAERWQKLVSGQISWQLAPLSPLFSKMTMWKME